MAIIVDKDGNVVTVENQPEEARELFQNLRDGEQAASAAEAAALSAEASALSAEAAAEQAMSGTPDGYSNLVDSIADDFSSGTDYKTGDYVLYESKLYRFTADHDAGAWSASDVEAVTVGEGLSDLNDALNQKAPVINAVREAKYTDLSAIGIITGTEAEAYITGLGIARMCAYNDKNWMGDLSQYEIIQQWSANSVTVHSDHFTLDGSATRRIIFGKNGNSLYQLDTAIPAGTVYCGAIIKGNSTGSGDMCRVEFNFYDDQETRVTGSNALLYDSSSWFASVNLARPAKYLNLIINYTSGWECDDLEVYPFIFVNSQYIKDNNVIAADTDVPLNISGWTKLSTAPYTHTISYDVDTKYYIDGEVPDDVVTHPEIADFASKQELKFVTPEMFGAAGDYTTDDTAAIQAAIDYAIDHGVAVRAFSKYKTTDTLTIHTDDFDFYFNWINCTTADTTMEVIGSRNRIWGTRLLNTLQSGSGGDALLITATEGKESNSNLINIVGIYANRGRDIVITSSGSTSIFCNEFRVKRLYSRDSCCIYIGNPELPDSPEGAETRIIGDGAPVSCASWAIISYMRSPALFISGLDMESSCQKGMYCANFFSGAHFSSCRVAEMLNQIGKDLEDSDRGIFAKGKGVGKIFIEDFGLDYISIDVSECLSYEDIIETYTSIDASGMSENLIPVHRYGDTMTYDEDGTTQLLSTGRVPMGTEMLVNFDKLYVISPQDFIFDFDADATIPNCGILTGFYDKIIPTVFNITDTCNITLSQSYNPIANTKITVLQDDANATAQIYDGNNNLIFDGATLGAGRYEIRCVIDSREIMEDQSSRIRGLSHLFTGDNMAWYVNKLDAVLPNN